MLKLLLAAPMALALATPATPQESTIPVDTVAEAKFPKDDPATVDALSYLNKAVNSNITYMTDKEHYGLDDHYVSLPADDKGDCEDFALSKMELLSKAGFPVVTNAKLVGVIVHFKSKGKDEIGGHMILAIRLKSGDVAYLDLSRDLMTRKELEAKGYQFFDWVA